MLNSMLRCPVTIESLSHYVRPNEVLGKVDLFWGRDSFNENVVKAKVKHTYRLPNNKLIPSSVTRQSPSSLIKHAQSCSDPPSLVRPRCFNSVSQWHIFPCPSLLVYWQYTEL